MAILHQFRVQGGRNQATSDVPAISRRSASVSGSETGGVNLELSSIEYQAVELISDGASSAGKRLVLDFYKYYHKACHWFLVE